MCAVGWCIEANPDATLKDRAMDTLFIALLETIVAAATLVYCLFIMPLFFTITNAWLQMAWLCILHPLYFEIFTGYIVRKALYRNRTLGRTDVVYFLTIVHSMVHITARATSLQVHGWAGAVREHISNANDLHILCGLLVPYHCTRGVI